ncbi:MAG: single-stranded DNA-binding protein [Lachnospiraceae bacterium]
MNKVILMGRLTRDPEIRYGGQDNQMAIARFSLAVDRRFKRAGDSADADFFNCTAFGKQAEFVERYLKQGTKILLGGRVQNDNYTNKEGQKVYSVQIIAEELEFAESKNASANNQNMGGGYAAPAGRPSPAAAVGDGFMNIPDGVDDVDLPFN